MASTVEKRDLKRTGQVEFSLEPVRMVAIDEDFSAVRFRRVEFIKTMTRGKEHRMSAQGKARAARK